MANASAGAISALVINSLLVLVLTGGVIMYQSELAGNFYILLAACMAIVLCVYPPTVATYINLTGTVYSYENYILQVFLPMCVGFAILLSISFFDVLKNFDEYHEQLILFLGAASILSSTFAYTFLMFRIKYHGT
jgi:hypothetical protein